VTPLDPALYRTRAEEFLGALNKEEYEHLSGQKETCDVSAIYERYPDLFTRAAVDELNVLYDAAKDDEKRRLAYLLAATVSLYMGEQTKGLADELANEESKATIEIDGEAVAFRYSSVLLANENDRDRRARIQDARRGVIENVLTPRCNTLMRQSHDLAAGLGYPHYKALFAEVKGIDYDHVRAQTDAFLQDTESIYERVMDKLVRAKMGFGLSELRFSDLPYLWRAPEYDRIFSADRLLPTLSRMLADMGINLAAQTNVHVDAEARELKTPRAFCSPVRVPEEIYLVVMPKGGQDDYGALLHEAGHTEHFAHVRPGLAFEYRHLGDNAVTEGYAFLFDHLTFNPRWLDVYLDCADADDFVKFANIQDLYMMRRYAGKLAYETRLHEQTASLDGMATVYSECLSEATKVDVPASNYLVDVDDGFYCASYLRAWMLEGALRMMLQDRHGMEWFRDATAGAWVKELWSHGQQFTAEQLLLKYGGGRLDADPLKHHFERALGR
jgi:hypothetical protein